MTERNQIAERFRSNAISYLGAAKILLGHNEADYLIAPCCHSIGVSIELFLKARLYRSVNNPEKLAKRLGHDLLGLWNQEWASDIRDIAEQTAPNFIDRIMAKPLARAAPTGLTGAQELKRHLEWLAEGYGPTSDYALRYPRGITTTVPSPEFLIPIFEHVYDCTVS